MTSRCDVTVVYINTVHNRFAHSMKMKARVKNTPRKDVTVGQRAKFPLICVDCGQRFGHRQSPSRHKRKKHMATVSAVSTMSAVSAWSAQSAAAGSTQWSAAAVSEDAVSRQPPVDEDSLPGLLSPISSIGELATASTWSLSELMEVQPGWFKR